MYFSVMFVWCLPACLPVCLSACLPVCLSACLPVCLSACLPVCLSVCTTLQRYFYTNSKCNTEIMRKLRKFQYWEKKVSYKIKNMRVCSIALLTVRLYMQNRFALKILSSAWCNEYLQDVMFNKFYDHALLHNEIHQLNGVRKQIRVL